MFIGSTNAPLSLVDCEEFRDLLSEMDRRYDIPHRWKLGQEINKLYDRLKHNISLHLENAKRVILCCDVWSKQGMTASFLGITVHFFTHHDKKRHSITLACRRFPSPHTGDRIAELLESVLDEWQISKEKVFRSLTDNGSNMIRAFNLLQNKSMDLSQKVAENVEEMEELEDENVKLDEEIEEVEVDENAEFAVADMREFEQCEMDHGNALATWKRISCFAHTLQLVVEFERAPCFNLTLKKAHSIIKKSQ